MEPNKEQNDLGTESANYILVQVASVAMAFVWSICIARWLGPSGYGVIGVVLTAAVVAAQVCSMGIHQGCIYALGQGGNGESIYSAVVIFSVLMMVLLFGGAVLFGDLWIPVEEGSLGPSTVIAASSVLIATFFWTLLDPLLIGLKFSDVRNRSKLLYEGGRLALTFGLYFTALSRDYATALGVIAVSYSCAFAAALFHLEKEIGFRPTSIDVRAVRQLFSYGAKLYPGNLLQLAAYRIDIFIVTALLGTSYAGQYLVATQLAEMLWLIPSAIGILIFRRVSAGDESWPPVRVAALARQTILGLAAGSTIVALSAAWLIPFLFGEAFSNAIIPFLLLLPGALSICLHKVLIFAIIGVGRPQFMTVSGLTLFILVVVLDLVLIPRYGLIGAALASTLAYLCSAALTTAYFLRIFRVSTSEVLVPRWSDVSALADFVRKRKMKLL